MPTPTNVEFFGHYQLVRMRLFALASVTFPITRERIINSCATHMVEWYLTERKGE